MTGARISLRAKLTLLVFLATAVTGIALTWADHRKSRLQAQNLLLRSVETSSRLLAGRLETRFDALLRDGETVRRLPPVTGLVGTLAAVGVPASGKDVATWRAEVEGAFATFLAVRPSYRQIRLIGAAESWKEIVRVDQDADGITAVAESALQQKGGEPYLQPLQNRAALAPYFSDVTYNREWGQVEGAPTIRMILPVLAPNGELFGALVFNLDYEAWLNGLAPQVAPGGRVTMINEARDHILFSGEAGTAALNFHEDDGWRPPEVAARRPADDGGWMTDTGVAFSSSVGGGATIPVHHVIAERPLDPLARVMNAALHRDLLLALALSLGAAGLSLLVAGRLLAPLTRLTEAVRRRDGAEPLPVKASRVNDEVGDLARAFSAMSNRLMFQAARSRQIIDHAADGIITIDMSGTIEDANDAVCEIFGYAREELVGGALSRLMPSDVAAHHHAWVQASTAGSTAHMMARDRDLHGFRKDGSPVPIEVSVSSVTLDGERLFIGLVRDVTARKVAQRQREELIRSLKRSNAELDQFAYVASHDLKAPLRVIDNTSRWLLEDLEDFLDEDTRDSFELMRSRVARMERLLDDLLAHSRIGRVDAGRDMATGADMAEAIEALLPPRGEIRLDFSDRFRALEMQRFPLETVLLNLVSNAVRHHDRETGSVRVDAERKPDHLRFEVADDGPGIPPEFHEKIFGLFQTLRPRDALDTSGMGLAMVRKHVEIAGGRIDLESDGRRGTIFRVHWPEPQDVDQKEAA